MSIVPGSMIRLEIGQLPRAAAPRKTIMRLCAKDPAVQRAHRRRQDKRPSWQEWVRGGMMWHHQMKSRAEVTVQPGGSYTLRATVDVLRDLQSVKDYVRVSKA